MARPILRLATHLTRRTRMTAWAIAFACMVLVGALSLAEGLANGIESVTGRIDTGPALYIRGPELLRSEIDSNSVAGLPGTFVAIQAHPADLEVNGLIFPIIVVALVHYDGGEPSSPFPEGRDDLSLDVGLRARIEGTIGGPVPGTGNLSLFDLPEPLPLPIVAAPLSRPIPFPDDWAYVRSDLLAAMSLERGGPVQGILADEALGPSVVQDLGLTRLDTVGAIGFVRGGIEQVQASLRVLAVIVAVVIGLLVYAAMSLEVHQSGREIRILRSLGATPRAVARVYEARAILLAIVGGILGAALGICVANAVVSFAPFAGLPHLVILEVPLAPIGLTLLVVLASASLAGLVPSRRAAILARSKGAVPS